MRTSHPLCSPMQRNVAARVGAVAITAFLLTTTSALAIDSGTRQVSGQSSGATNVAAANALPEVTVTAQYIAQPLQTTPVSISAVTSQTLEQRGIVSLADLTTSVPSLTLKKAPAAFGSAVQAYIRGVGQYDSAFASEPGVGMYVDDEYYGTLFGSNLQLLDLDRVEVLRGPQGVLGGKNNIGGAIRLFTQKPKGDGSGYLQATYGSFNKINVKGAVDVSIIPDHLFARVTAMSRNQDGYMTVLDYACMNRSTSGSLPVRTLRPDCKIGKMGGTNVQGGRIALRAIFSPQIEDNLSVDVIRDNSQTQANTLIATDPGTGSWNPSGDVSWFNGNKVVSVPRNQFFTARSDGTLPTTGPNAAEAQLIANYGIPWDKRFIPANPYRQTYATYTTAQGNNYTEGAFVHSWSVNNIFDWDILDNVHFKNITGYRTYDAGNSADDDVSPVDWGLATSYPYNREFQEEARFTGNLFDGHLDWTVGGFYYHRLNRQSGPVILGAIVPALVFEQRDKYVTTNKSAYLNVIYHPTNNLDLFGGLRYTKEDKTFYFDHSGQVPGYPGSGFFRSTVDPQYSCNSFDPTVPLCDHSISPALQPHTSKTSRPDWRGGVDYHLTDDKMVYFSFSTGYRTGGTNSRPFTPAQLDSYGPETLKSYEIGAKTQWLDDRLRLNVSLYTANYSNIITPTNGTDPYLPGILPYVKYVNLSSAKDRGFELEAQFTPIDNLLIDADMSYTHLKSNPVPGAPDGWLDGCSAAGYAAGICDANPNNYLIPGTAIQAPHTAPGTTMLGSHSILFPNTTFHVGAQYAFNLDGAGKVTPRLDYSWQSRIFEGANNSPYREIKARGLLDGRVTWDAPSSDWQVSVSVKNLLNKKYYLSLFDVSTFGEGALEAQPGMPREWDVTIKRSF